MGVLSTEVAPKQVLVMEQELKALLEKGAIKYVPHSNRETRFYSRYFIVPKKDEGLHPILDYSSSERLRHAAQVQNVNFETNRATDQIRGLVCHDRSQGRILPHNHPSVSQEVPEVRFWGKVYQYRVFPFGLALSPRTFTECIDAALVPLRLQGISGLILAQSHQLAVRHRDVLLAHMKELG